MKRTALIAIMLAALMLCACTPGVHEAASFVTNAPAGEPIDASVSAPSDAPTTEPADTPAPTAEPDPYRYMEVIPTPGPGEHGWSSTAVTCWIYELTSVKQLASLSECIVLARVTNSVCVNVPVRFVFDEDGTPHPDETASKNMHTVYDIEILQVYKGREAASSIKRIMVYGGDLCGPDETGMRTQPYQVGGEYVLFLKRPHYGKYWLWPEIATHAESEEYSGIVELDDSGERIIKSKFEDLTWEWLESLEKEASNQSAPREGFRIEPWNGIGEDHGSVYPYPWAPGSMEGLLAASSDVVRVLISADDYEKHIYPEGEGFSDTYYYTIYHAQVTGSYMGETNAGDMIKVEIWQGMDSNGRICLEEHPFTLNIGQEYVLFLAKDKDFEGYWYPPALYEGVHPVIHDSTRNDDGTVTETEWVDLGYGIDKTEGLKWLEKLKNDQ